jgi:hypothetical protein
MERKRAEVIATYAQYPAGVKAINDHVVNRVCAKVSLQERVIHESGHVSLGLSR